MTKYAVIGGLNGAYAPAFTLGPVETREEAEEILEEKREDDIEAEYTKEDPKPERVGEIEDGQYIVDRGERAISRKVEIVKFKDEEVQPDYRDEVHEA